MTTHSPSWRTMTGPSGSALIDVRPCRSPSSTPSIETSSHSTQVVGRPGITPPSCRWKSLPPIGIAPNVVHSASGVGCTRSHVECHISTSSAAPRQRQSPRAITGPRVVHGHHATVRFGGRAPHVGRLAEVDPRERPEAVRMTVVRRDLLARQQEHTGVGAGSGEMRMVADRVVVGDREHVEATGGREHGQLGDLEPAVGVDGMAVEVARQPRPSGARRQVAPRWSFRSWRQRSGRPAGRRRSCRRRRRPSRRRGRRGADRGRPAIRRRPARGCTPESPTSA